MQYYYDGRVRLTLWFDTPNHAGAMACALLVFLVACDPVIPRPMQGRVHWAVAALLSVGIVALASAAAATYSRGALIGIVAGLSCIALLQRRISRTLLLALGSLVLAVLFVPRAVHRLQIAPMHDRSISNRLVVWDGALRMAADFPATGVRLEDFREVYATWYQSPDRFQVYKTPVSDPLTFLVTCGYGVFFALVAGGLGLLAAAGKLAWESPAPLLVATVAAVLSFLACGFFSTLATSWKVAWLPLLLLLVIVLCVARARRQVAAFLPAAATWGCVLSAVVCLAGIGRAWASAESFPAVPDRKSTAFAMEAQPRAVEASSFVVYVTDQWFPELDGRRFLRPLTAAGLGVAMVDCPTDMAAAVARVQSYCRAVRGRFQSGASIYLVGYGQAGRAAILAAARAENLVTGVVLIGAPLWWPAAAWSPLDQLNSFMPRLCIIHGENDRISPLSHAQQLHDKARGLGIHAELQVLQGADHAMATEWETIARIVTDFTKTQ